MGKDMDLESRIKYFKFLRLLFLILALILIIGPIILLIFAAIARANHLYSYDNGMLIFFGWFKIPYHLCKYIYVSAPSLYFFAVALLILRVALLGPKLRRLQASYDEASNLDENNESPKYEESISRDEPRREEVRPINKPLPKEVEKGVEFFNDI